MVRKFTKSKSIFPTDDSIRKVIYLSVKEVSKKWTMPVRDWGLAYSQFAIFFEDRLAAWRLLRALPSNSRGLSALEISGGIMKNDDISAIAFHRFISQPASGHSSALPLLAAFLVLSLILGKLHLHSLFFRPACYLLCWQNTWITFLSWQSNNHVLICR